MPGGVAPVATSTAASPSRTGMPSTGTHRPTRLRSTEVDFKTVPGRASRPAAGPAGIPGTELSGNIRRA